MLLASWLHISSCTQKQNPARAGQARAQAQHSRCRSPPLPPAPASSQAADLTRMVSWMVQLLPSFLSATTMACLLRGGGQEGGWGRGREGLMY